MVALPEHLQNMVAVVEALVQDGFSREEVAEPCVAAVAYLDSGARVPCARGNRTAGGVVQLTFNEYRWARLIRVPGVRHGAVTRTP